MAHGTRFTEAELERIAAEHDAGSTDADETAEWSVDDGAQETGTTTMSIRLPVSMVAALKAAAEKHGVGATVLARQWIMERLIADGTNIQGTVEVSDLLALVFGSQGVAASGSARKSRARVPARH